MVEQYKNASNLDIRIGLHQKYSQNPQPWFEWIYEQLNLKEKDKVLELRCEQGNCGRIKIFPKMSMLLIRPVTRYGKKMPELCRRGKRTDFLSDDRL